MILLDTHTLIWWVDDSTKLPDRMKKKILEESKKGMVLISAISIWEVSLLLRKGRIDLPKDIEAWIGDIEKLSFIQFIPIDNRIALKSVDLPGNFHGDPADRFIVATAREYGAIIITSDQKILRYKEAQSLW